MSANTGETGVTMAFLISNFHTLVKIQLSSDNYLLWKTQVLNALRANGYIEYVDGTIGAPPLQIRDTSNNLITNPAYLRWQLIDNQLLSCLTASLSPSTLPLVLGLEHACEVWSCLEKRFNSLSRSNIHDLKRTLFNFTKTGTMEQYIDEIKICTQKLSAVGYMVDDDDMVFHTLNGLSGDFDPIKCAIGTQRDLKFHELIPILKAEESRIHKSKGESSSTSVFVATQKLQDLSISGSSGSTQGSMSQNTGPFSVSTVPSSQPPMIQSQMLQPQMVPVQAPMFQSQFFQGSFFPHSSQSGTRFNNNRNKAKRTSFCSFL